MQRAFTPHLPLAMNPLFSGWHVQQENISVENEITGKISAEIENFDAESVDSEISYGEITTRENELDNDIMRLNSVKLLEEFQEYVINGSTKRIYSNETIQSVQKDKEETSAKKDNLHHYLYENESYTISDDDDNEQVKDSEISTIMDGQNVTNNFKKSEVIEISDDELCEDSVAPCRIVPHIANEECYQSNINELLKYADTEESSERRTSSFPYAVPTPSESLKTPEYNANINCDQLNYKLTVYNKDMSINQNRKTTRKKSKTFLAFQCELCGIRTSNQNTMEAHLDRHSAALKNLGRSRNSHQHYHQLQQSSQNMQQNGSQNKILRKPFKCKSCNVRTVTLKGMERHQQLFHGPEANLLAKQCGICHKRILTNKFELHMKIHFSLGFNCKYCGIVYKQKNLINYHIKKYHADTNFN